MRVVSSLIYVLACAAAGLAAVSYGWDAANGLAPQLVAEHLIALGASLEAWQAGVQRHVSADLWDQVFVPALTTPTVVVLGGLALAFTAIGYAARPRRR